MSSEDPKGWIYAGGLPYELSEGDVICAFSQFGEIEQCTLVRDKETGKSRGFGFIKYQDPRSCELSVDNFNGSVIVGRKIKVSFANNVNAIKTLKPPITDATQDKDGSPEVDDRRRQRGRDYERKYRADKDEDDNSPDLKRRHEDNFYADKQRHRDLHHEREGERNSYAERQSRRHYEDRPSSRSGDHHQSNHHRRRHHSRSLSPKRRHHSRSPSPKRRHHSRSPSPKRRHHSISPSPKRRHHSKSISPKRRHHRRDHSESVSPERKHHRSHHHSSKRSKHKHSDYSDRDDKYSSQNNKHSSRTRDSKDRSSKHGHKSRKH